MKRIAASVEVLSEDELQLIHLVLLCYKADTSDLISVVST